MSATMLPRAWDLTFTASGEVVTDVEALARGVMGVEGWPRSLEAADNDELLGFLLGEAAFLETRYIPRDGIEARPWLFQRLRYASRDWRERAERHRALGDLPPVLDWDTGVSDYRAEERSRVSGIGSPVLDVSPGASPGDRRDSGLDALRGLLEEGDRRLLREVEALGLGAPHRARARARGTSRRAPGGLA